LPKLAWIWSLAIVVQQPQPLLSASVVPDMRLTKGTTTITVLAAAFVSSVVIAL